MPHMHIERAKVLGQCMGVRRAEELALQAALDAAAAGADSNAMNVFTLGPLIHNQHAVAALEKAGISVLDVEAFEAGRMDDIVRGARVVIRAHGAPPESFAHLAALGATVIDATCPRVLASQKRARAYAEAGYTVIVAGDKSHAEVAGILGHARAGAAQAAAAAALVAGDAADAAAIAAALLGRKVAVIAQTTILREEYEAIKAAIAVRCPDLESFDSLCPATQDRQAALAALAQHVDALIVVGGKASANTLRLFRAALDTGKAAWHVETAAELPQEVFDYARLGLTAGASTPDNLVDAVETALKQGRRQPPRPRQ